MDQQRADAVPELTPQKQQVERPNEEFLAECAKAIEAAFAPGAIPNICPPPETALGAHKEINALRELRKASGMTQLELARKLGMKGSGSISRWETGDRYPPSKMLLRLADMFHCATDELLGRGTGQGSA